MLSLGAAKGIEFGAGFAAAAGHGSEQNDWPVPGNSGAVAENSNTVDHRELLTGMLPAGVLPAGVPALSYKTNNSGGVLGGISTGMPLEFRVAFKPIPSISKQQQTVDRTGTVRDLAVAGRHDVCVCPRAVPVVEAMAAMVLADLLLLARCSRI
jgi:chorismate synthase